MRRALRLAILAYLVTVSATALVAFRYGFAVSPATGYVLLFLLYAIPVEAVLRTRPPPIVLGFFLVVTPLLPMLVVVDPLETGFFGYDPYMYTLPALDAFATEPLLSMFNVHHAWPLFYAYTAAVVEVLGIPVQADGKAVTLVVAGIPLLVFLMGRELVDDRIAFVVAMGVAGTRTILVFETKFVEQGLGVLLLFALVAAFVLTHAGSRKLAVAIPIVTALHLTHHATSAIATFFLVAWYLAVLARRHGGSLGRFRPTRTIASPTIGIVGYSTAAFLFVFFVLAPEFTRTQSTSVYQAIVLGQLTEPSGPGIGEGLGLGGWVTLAQQIGAIATLAVIATFSAICAAGILSRYRATDWETAWIAFSGALIVQYVVSQFAGRIVPLDPIRLLSFFVPTLFAAGGAIVMRARWPGSLSRPGRRRLVAVLVLVFVASQLVALPPHVVYTDPDETALVEGHYTPEQFRASAWVGENVDGPVYAHEGELWAAGGTQNVLEVTETTVCSKGVIAWRAEGPYDRPIERSTVYDVGSVSLHACGDDE